MAYSFQTGPSSHDPLGRSRTEISLEVALSILICLISILNNFLVVYVVNKDSRLKCVTNIFILNLALTDIFMATLYMPFWVISLHSGTWIFSEKWCQLSAAILSTLAATSHLTMGLIAFNRYVRVVKPAMYSRLFPSKGTILLRPHMDSFYTCCNTAVVRVGQDSLPSLFCYLHFFLEN